MIEQVCNTEKQKNSLEQLNEMRKNGKKIYFFGGLGDMSLGSVNAQFLKKNNLDFEGFIANKKYIHKHSHLGKPVFALEDCTIARDVNIVIGISNWVDAKRELELHGFGNIFLFDAFADMFLDQITEEYFLENQKKYQETYLMLDDDQSKKTMIAYLQGKIFHNFSGLASTYVGGGAYFSGILHFGDSEVMIDCGAFDGDTALSFAKICPNYSKIYALEPNAEMFFKLKQRTKSLKIKLFEVGAYSSRGFLNFQAEESGCSTITQEGSIKIPVDCIDSLVGEDFVTFIKMDIEGSELEALKGAIKTIKKYKPKLAICVYHRKDDLIEIPRFLKSIHRDYRFSLRNHQCVPEDTVLYVY